METESLTPYVAIRFPDPGGKDRKWLEKAGNGWIRFSTGPWKTSLCLLAVARLQGLPEPKKLRDFTVLTNKKKYF